MNTQKPVKSPKWVRTALFAVIAATAAGCNNEMPDAGNNNPDKQSGKMTIYAGTEQEAANTRVAYDDSQVGIAEGKALTWQEGDKLTVVRMNGNDYKNHKDDYLYQGSNGATSGSFVGTEIADAGDSWRVYYPNTVDVNSQDGTATLSMTGQTQTANGNTEHLRSHILLVATDLENITDNFRLEMKSSILKFNLTNVPQEVGKLTNLVWIVETPTGTKSITLNFAPETVNLDGNNSLTAYLSFMPQEMEVKAGGKFTVILIGDKAYRAEKTIAAGKKYAAGMRYTTELESWQEELATMSFTVKVDNQLGLGFNIPFPTTGTTPADITVNWGDGKGITQVQAGTSLSDNDEFNYTYDDAGTYTITITSAQANETKQQIPVINFSIRNPGWLNENPHKLISVDTPLLNMGTTDLSNCFQACSALTSIPENLFYKNTNVTIFKRSFASTDIESIPEGLFAKNTKATNFESCFNNNLRLRIIPKELFANNTEATSFAGCFAHCYALERIPEGLFTNNTAATNFEQSFTNCTSLKSIPEGLFAKNMNATNFKSCFDHCTTLVLNNKIFSTDPPAGNKRFTGKDMNFHTCFQMIGFNKGDEISIAPELWEYDRTNSTWNTSDCFSGTGSVSNWFDIPSEWGGQPSK